MGAEGGGASSRFESGRSKLFPLKLTQIKGDETQRQWVNFAMESANHPVLRGWYRQGRTAPQAIRKEVRPSG